MAAHRKSPCLIKDDGIKLRGLLECFTSSANQDSELCGNTGANQKSRWSREANSAWTCNNKDGDRELEGPRR